MNTNPLVFPLLVWWLHVFAIMLFTFFSRVLAVKKGQLKIADFRYVDFKPDQAPLAYVGTRHFANLFEIPVMWSMILVLSISLGIHNTAMANAAWLFVAFRIFHSMIHLTINVLRFRLAAFLASNLCMLVILLGLIFEILKAG